MVTGPQTAGDSRPEAGPTGADRVLVAASTAFLLVAPFAASAGLRGAALVAGGGALLAQSRASIDALRRVPTDFGIAALAWAALALASAAWSVDRAYTWGELHAEVLYGAAAFTIFFVAAMRRPAAWPLWWLATVLGAALAFAGALLQDVLPFAISRHAVDGGPGPYSTQLVLVAPMLLALAWRRPAGIPGGPAAFAAGLAFLALAAWTTGNRMVWIAFAVQLAVACACARRVNGTRGTRARVAFLVVGALVAAAFAASLLERSELFFHHADRVAVTLERDLRPRIWAAAWQAFHDAPWLGHGFGREVLAPLFEPLAPPGHPRLQHAHNMFIDTALELGVAGLAALAALLLALARRYRALLSDAALAPLGAIGLALLAGFVVKNLTDDFFYRHNALVFWALNGLLLGMARRGG